MVILMVSAFLVTWLPYAVLALHNVLYPDFQVRFLCDDNLMQVVRWLAGQN